MSIAVSNSHIASELLRFLKLRDYDRFAEYLKISSDAGISLDVPYGKDSSFKTILHLALEMEDGELYVEELIKNGASANHYNMKAGSTPMHIAAAAANPNVFKLLLTDSTSSSSSNNKANSNVVNKDGLTAFHILLAQLVDMASLENRPIETRGPNPPSNGEIEQRSRDVMECLILLAKERNLTMDFENSPKLAAAAVERAPYVRSKMTLKKIATMTPLQILCSFQTWNAKPITTGLHNSLAELVQLLLDQGANPNGTAAKGELPGTVPGSTPPVFLAATRGYYKVIQVFKENSHTDFLVVNKFDQTILHMVLKAGYYNKIVIHGEESGEVNINTLHELFSGNNRTIQYQMRGIVNNRDSYGNTALHYARPYPSPEVTLVTLLANGAKLDMNAQGQINMNPKALHRYFLEHCIIPVGDDIDDEDFKIKMDFRLFEKALDMGTEEMQVAKARADDAWALQVEQGKNNQTQPHFPGEDFTTDSGGGGDGNDGSGKVDTKRLEIFAREENLHHLLKSPLMTAFLEMEMNSLKIRYFLDFMLYLLFVIALFFYLSERYTLNPTAVDEALIIYRDEEMDYNVTYTLICLVLLLLILMGQEIFQIFKVGKRYFTNPGNYIEWIVMILVLFDVIPWHFLSFLGDTELQRHWAALTLLIAFMQLYLLLVRVVPDTPIPIYINMFTTVLKTYTLILLSYMAFILSFAYSFFLIFSPRPAADEQMVSADNSTTPSNTTVKDSDGDPSFSNLWLSVVKTLVMFIGEMDYLDLEFKHWLGYVVFVLFVFLMIIVLMNILNGLAVSDIHKIQEEVDTYHLVSIVETLAYTSFVPMLATRVLIAPNIKPEKQKILGIAMPGTKVYRATIIQKKIAEGDDRTKKKKKKPKYFYFSENTVKLAKGLVSQKLQRQQQPTSSSLSEEQHQQNDFGWETVGESLSELRREQQGMKSRIKSMEENVNMVLEIMLSRQPRPPVQN